LWFILLTTSYQSFKMRICSGFRHHSQRRARPRFSRGFPFLSICVSEFFRFRNTVILFFVKAFYNFSRACFKEHNIFSTVFIRYMIVQGANACQKKIQGRPSLLTNYRYNEKFILNEGMAGVRHLFLVYESLFEKLSPQWGRM
jgi:hypothetical protein